MDDLRRQVRAVLKESGMSQASACRHLGISQKHMSQMLTGRTPLTLGWAEQILGLCGRRLVIKVVKA